MLFHLTHFNAPRFFNKLIKSSMMYFAESMEYIIAGYHIAI